MQVSGLSNNTARLAPNFELSVFWDTIRIEDGVETRGREMTLRNNVKWMFGNFSCVIVRDCYTEYADKILTNPSDTVTLALIRGIKGIGKTVFLNYLMARIVKHHRENRLPVPSILVFRENNDVVRFNSEGVFICDRASPSDEYCLSDSVDIPVVYGIRKAAVLVSSQNPSQYSKFLDRMNESCRRLALFMQPWSLTEIRTAFSLSVLPEVEAKFLYDIFNGSIREFAGYLAPSDANHIIVGDYIHSCARWFFGDDFETLHSNVWNYALESIRSRLRKKRIDVNGASCPDAIHMSSLFWNEHIMVSDHEYIEGFTSPFMKFLAGALREQADTNIWNAVKSLFGSSGEGNAFETVGHQTLTGTSCSYTATNLKKFMRNTNPEKSISLNFCGLPRILIRTIEDIKIIPDKYYGLPIFSNYPLVDAIIQPNILLQFTISKSHGSAEDVDKYAAIRSQLRGPSETHKLIFVTKPECVEEFKAYGVPGDLQCYTMVYLPSSSLVKKRRRGDT